SRSAPWRLALRSEGSNRPRSRRAHGSGPRSSGPSAATCRLLSRLLGLAWYLLAPARLAGLGALVELTAVSAKCPRRGKLAELVPDHIRRQIGGNKLVSVVNSQRVSDEIRGNRRTARPGLDHALLAPGIHRLDLLQQA